MQWITANNGRVQPNSLNEDSDSVVTDLPLGVEEKTYALETTHTHTERSLGSGSSE